MRSFSFCCLLVCSVIFCENSIILHDSLEYWNVISDRIKLVESLQNSEKTTVLVKRMNNTNEDHLKRVFQRIFFVMKYPKTVKMIQLNGDSKNTSALDRMKNMVKFMNNYASSHKHLLILC